LIVNTKQADTHFWHCPPIVWSSLSISQIELIKCL